MRLMDCAEIKVEMAEGGLLLERLVITEEGDETEGVGEKGAASGSAVIAESNSGESALKEEEEHTGEDKAEDCIATTMCFEDQSPGKQQSAAEDGQTEEVVVTEEGKQEDDKQEETESLNDGQNRGESTSDWQTHKEMRINENPEKPSDTEGDNKATENDPEVDIKRLDSSEQQPEGTQSEEEDPKKVCGLFFFLFFSKFTSHIPRDYVAVIILTLSTGHHYLDISRWKNSGGIVFQQSMWDYVGVE